MIRDITSLPHCAAIHEGEHLTPEQIEADPLFTADPWLLLDEMVDSYGEDVALLLWVAACHGEELAA